jgi:hypothetical protein
MQFPAEPGPPGMAAGIKLGSFAKQNSKPENGRDAVFGQRKGLKRKYRRKKVPGTFF